MKYRIVLFLIIVIAVCFSCGDSHVGRLLDDSEKLMAERPDSSLTILESIANSDISDRRQKARHALLLSEARYKNYVREENDSLISVAVDYYEKKGSVSERMRAAFYKSCILSDMLDIHNSIIESNKAYDLAEETGDAEWMAKCAQQSAFTYYEGYNFPRAIEYWDKAIANYNKAGMPRYAAYAELGRAKPLKMEERQPEAIARIDSVLKLYPEMLKEENFAFLCYTDMLSLYVSLGNYKEGEKYAELLLAPEFKDGLLPSNYSYISQIYLSKDNKEGIRSIIERVDSMPEIPYEDFHSAMIHFMYESKYGTFDRYKVVVDSLNNISTRNSRRAYSQSVATAEANYNKFRRKEAENYSSMITLYWIASVIIFLLVIAIIVISVYNKNKENRRKIAGYLNLTDNMTVQLEENKMRIEGYLKEIAELESNVRNIGMGQDESVPSDSERDSVLKRNVEILRLESFLKDNLRSELNEIEKISKKYFDNSYKKSARETLKEIGRRVEEIKKGEILTRIDQYNELIHNGVIKTLLDSDHGLNEKEVLMVRLTGAGLSREAICLLGNISVTNFYTIRGRIVKKLEGIGSPVSKAVLDIIKSYKNRKSAN